MIKENRVSKYMIYAIGEIVLVVIGILIALQVNNWNEEKKENRAEEKLLASLRSDFKENEFRLGETIARQEKMIRYSKSLIHVMSTNNLEIASDSIADMIWIGAGSWWRTEFVTGTYDAILSSGNINVLKHDSLKRVLAEFSTEVKSGFEDHAESMSYMVEMGKRAAPFSAWLVPQRLHGRFHLSGNEAATASATSEIIKDKAYLGLLINKTTLELNRIDHQLKIQKYVQDILSILESELKK
jgi:hypothetical protein